MSGPSAGSYAVDYFVFVFLYYVKVCLSFGEGVFQFEAKQGEGVCPFKAQVVTHSVFVVGVAPYGDNVGFFHVT